MQKCITCKVADATRGVWCQSCANNAQQLVRKPGPGASLPNPNPQSMVSIGTKDVKKVEK